MTEGLRYPRVSEKELRAAHISNDPGYRGSSFVYRDMRAMVVRRSESPSALRVFLIETQSGLHEDGPVAIKAVYGRGMCEFKRLNQQVETAKTQQALLTRLGEFRLKMETAGLEF